MQLREKKKKRKKKHVEQKNRLMLGQWAKDENEQQRH